MKLAGLPFNSLRRLYSYLWFGLGLAAVLFALVGYDIWNDLGTAKDKIQKFKTSIKVSQDSMKVMRKKWEKVDNFFKPIKQ